MNINLASAKSLADVKRLVERVGFPPRIEEAVRRATTLTEIATIVAARKVTFTNADAVVKAELINAVQAKLDEVAQSRGYDGILSLCSYATSSDTTFAAEGQAGVAWRDAVWRHCYNLLAEVQAGTKPVPTVEELVAGLPTITW